MNLFHIRDLDLNLLLVFDCIYREGNLTAVGRHLGRTRSAVSHALDRLRAQLDDPLFVRTHRGMRPTPRACELAPAIRQALETIQTALKPPDAFAAESLTRTFRIAMSDYSEMIVLPALMEYLCQRAPEVRIEVRSTAALQAQTGLESGELELVIGNQEVGAGVLQQVLFVDQFACAARCDHSAISPPLAMEQYLECRHVVFAPQGRGDRLLDEALRRRRIERKVALRVPHILAIPPILKSTPFIVTLPRRLGDALDDADLQFLEPPLDLPPLPVMQYWHEAMHRDPAHRWLRGAIQEICKEL